MIFLKMVIEKVSAQWHTYPLADALWISERSAFSYPSSHFSLLTLLTPYSLLLTPYSLLLTSHFSLLSSYCSLLSPSTCSPARRR